MLLQKIRIDFGKRKSMDSQTTRSLPYEVPRDIPTYVRKIWRIVSMTPTCLRNDSTKKLQKERIYEYLIVVTKNSYKTDMDNKSTKKRIPTAMQIYVIRVQKE